MRRVVKNISLLRVGDRVYFSCFGWSSGYYGKVIDTYIVDRYPLLYRHIVGVQVDGFTSEVGLYYITQTSEHSPSHHIELEIYLCEEFTL